MRVSFSFLFFLLIARGVSLIAVFAPLPPLHYTLYCSSTLLLPLSLLFRTPLPFGRFSGCCLSFLMAFFLDASRSFLLLLVLLLGNNGLTLTHTRTHIALHCIAHLACAVLCPFSSITLPVAVQPLSLCPSPLSPLPMQPLLFVSYFLFTILRPLQTNDTILFCHLPPVDCHLSSLHLSPLSCSSLPVPHCHKTL